MRKMLLIAGCAVLVAAPSLSAAATRCEQHQADRKAAGTVIGAIAGGLLGNAVSRGGGRTGGTVIGAVGGAVVGNQLARQNNVCPDGYTAYDDGRGPEPAYYTEDSYPGERDYYEHYHHHSQAYLDYRRQRAEEADAYGRDSAAYSGDGRTWRDGYGHTCRWRDQADRRDDGGWSHRWVQDCR